MQVWETDPTAAAQSPAAREFAEIWQAADKVVYSQTLDAVGSTRTRIERDFDPDAIRRMKDEADADVGVGGSELAAQAIEAGLVDELHLFLVPILVGGGKQALPDGVRVGLELLDSRTFDSGFVDGGFVGTGSAVGGLSGRMRMLQNGFVRSYALSVLGGAALVLLALVVVNLG